MNKNKVLTDMLYKWVQPIKSGSLAQQAAAINVARVFMVVRNPDLVKYGQIKMISQKTA